MNAKTPRPFIKKKRQGNVSVDPSNIEDLAKSYIVILSKAPRKFPKAKFACKLCQYHMDDIDRAYKHSYDNMHKKNLKKLETRNLLTYLPNPTKVQLDSIKECLERTLEQNHFITNEEYERRVDICLKMNEITGENTPGSRLIICGSLRTGMSLKTASDVNLYLDTQTKDMKNTGYLSELKKFRELFKTKLGLKTEIKLEKVNCGLFCKDKQGVVYHISVSNRLQHLNSELIQLYLKIDNRAENLAKLFRYFAHIAFIDQIKDGFFPSESFALLVIYYLQQLDFPILPNVHKLADLNSDIPETFVTTIDIYDSTIKYVSDINMIKQLWTPPANDLNLADLWIGLLKFYIVEFNSSAYMVSISSTLPVLKSDRNIINKRLAIEKPFDIKRNILFGWNSPDVIDFLNDQLNSCYSYFAVPQLATGSLFTKVSFREISLANLKSTANVTPIFTKDNFAEAMDMLDKELKILYTKQKAFYDISRYPVELFVKSCLSKILTLIFNSPVDIREFVHILELKIKNSFQYFPIENYIKFKEYAFRLAQGLLQEFSDYFEKKSLWGKPDLDTRESYDLIKKSCQKFVNETLNIVGNDEDDDDDDSIINEMEEVVADREFGLMEELLIDLNDTISDETICNNALQEEPTHTKVQDSEVWKLPYFFKQIYTTIKGCAISSNELDEYNENKFNSLNKKDLVYDFSKIPMHDKKLVIVCSLCNNKDHRKENCNHAIPRYEEFEDILKSINPNWLSKLKGILREKYKEIIPTGDKMKLNEKIFEKIAEIIKALYPTARPQMFGSVISGFITRASDLDVCLEFYVDEKRQILSNKELTSRLRIIGREIKKIPTINRVDYILRAKVPIVKFYAKSNVQGDISINNSLGLQNTKMLKLYSEIATDVKLLGNLIKFVVKTCDIGDAAMGTLSSYAYMLMLIHFLQKRCVLPVLQEMYEGERPIVMIDGWDAWYQSDMNVIYKLWKNKNENNYVENLWLDFFYYYAVEFDIDKEVISIRQSEPLYKIDKNWQSAYMAIEDPFNLSHNLSGSLSLENCRYILECFAHILEMHSNSENLKRPEQVHHLLLDPASLRPPMVNNRSCFNCNKSGHIARDCKEKESKRTPTKPGTYEMGLPMLTSPLQFKQSDVPNRVYLQSQLMSGDNVDSVIGNSVPNIPLKSFKADISEYSVVPISVKFGDKTVIIPVLMGENDIVVKELNVLLKNGLNNNVCVFPTENTQVTIDPMKQQQQQRYQQGSHQQNDELRNHSPANNTSRRRVHIISPGPNANRISTPQQQNFNRSAVMNHLNNNRYHYDQIRLLANNNHNGPRILTNTNHNGPRMNQYSIPPGFQNPFQPMYQNWTYGHDPDNRSMPVNNNHPTHRGPRN